jgi:phosphohistidine phosphatase SixA
MIVFLIRRAADVDAARALAWRLRWHDCTPTAVWTSPHPLAATTARILVEVLEWLGPVEVEPALGPGHDDPTRLASALASLAPDAAVVLVGHEPLLSALGRALDGGEALPALAEGEAVRFDHGEPRWRFTHDGAAPVPGHEWPR